MMFCDDDFCILYLQKCTFTYVHFSTTMFLDIDSTDITLTAICSKFILIVPLL